MEPLDPTKTDERRGSSKRRISSILKAPRKSIIFPDPEQENVVECAKPVEKRASRRVSFAPANDVLLFSKDAKNPPSTSSQDLTTTAASATQIRVQVAATEERSQQIAGMETLLNAPLHATQDWDKAIVATGNGFGEKTMIFPTDDALMDMTQSHTINIGTDDDIFADIPPPNYSALPTSKDKTVMFTADDGSMDMTLSHTMNLTSGSVFLPTSRGVELSAEKRNVSPAVLDLDLGFQSFLASLSKQSAPVVNPGITRMAPLAGPSSEEGNESLARIKTRRAEMNKENRAPTTVSAVMDKSVNGLRKTVKSPFGRGPGPEDDVNMDMTEAQTGLIQGPTDDDDDPFQCLFPTQEMYSQLNSRASQMEEKTKQQQSSKMLESSNTKDSTSLKNTLHTSHQKHKIKFDDCREKTVQFDACMDVTRSHTVNIATELLSNQNGDFVPTRGKKTAQFNANDAAMDVTQSHTVNIATELLSNQNGDLVPTRGKKTMQFNANDAAMDVTQSHTVNIATALRSRQNGDFLPPCGDKTVRFNANDAAMDVTQSHTVNIATELRSRHNVEPLPSCGDRTVRFNTNDAAMDVTQSHTVNIATALKSQQNGGFLPACGDKTVRFSANDAAMDVTQSHTVNIATELRSRHNVEPLPSCGDKTVRFNTNDAAMDVTQCLTVNIASDLVSDSVLPGKKQEGQTCGLPRKRPSSAHSLAPGFPSLRKPSGPGVDPVIERMMPTAPHPYNFGDSSDVDAVCPDDDVNMDMTEAQTGHIIGISGSEDPPQCLFSKQEVYPQSGHSQRVEASRQQHSGAMGLANRTGMEPSLPPCLETKMQRHQVKFDAEDDLREKTVRFTSDDGAMDMTQCHTVNCGVDLLPPGRDKTLRSTASDATMDATQSHSVNITNNSVAVHPHRDSNIFSARENLVHPLSVKKRESLPSHTLDPGLKPPLADMSSLWANPVITKTRSPQETVDTNGFLNQRWLPSTQTGNVSVEKESPCFASTVMENLGNQTVTDCPEADVSMDVTEAQTGRILEQTFTDEPPESLSSTKYPDPDQLNKAEVTSQQNSDTPDTNTDGVEVANHPDPLDSDESVNRKAPKPRSPTCSSGAVDHDDEAAPSQKSRRMTLADLHSKVRRLSHMIKTAPDAFDVDSRTAPLAQMEHDMDKNSKDKTKSLPATEPELETGSQTTEANTQAQCLAEGKQPSSATTTPFKLKNKQLMSRLSLGGLKPKLPQRNKPGDPKKAGAAGEHTSRITVNITNQLSNFDNDVSDIFDEELVGCDEELEMLDTSNQQKADEVASPSREFSVDGSPERDMFDQDRGDADHGNETPLPVGEQGMRASTDFETGADVGECNSKSFTAASMTTQATSYSNSSHTASIRCETTFESTHKQSLFESQLEDYASDVQRKLDDGTITVSEFLKLFSIDFVIHNPRQSVSCGRLLSDMERTPMDVLKDRHITHPKQMVYERNVLNLTETVDGLKVRMRDLDKPLRTVNRLLWEEMKNSSEKELKAFGAKLKQRQNLFRKTSKVRSHEMKEVLYSDLVRVNLEQQQKLRGTNEQADEMIKTLDDCIGELEKELAAVEENGFKDTPSLKARQEEMQKVTEALAQHERQKSELEIQQKQSSDKLESLKVQTRNLETHIATLDMLKEWNLGEKTDNCTTYTFLHDTFHLELVYEKSIGNVADAQSERKIAQITFKHQLDDEKSQGHACLVHKLLSQYIEGEAAWVKKYPTSRHVPRLLHDVGLVVSRCRLLGEELRLLKMWGGLRLDILSISCVDTQVHIVFSSLKKFSQFEVTFSVSLSNLIYVLQVHGFKNVVGSTTVQRIEEIVASVSPTKKLLTKIVKKIHENLLC